MPTYIWMSKRLGRKVHIAGEDGLSLCKVENNGAKTIAQLDGRGTQCPPGRKVCHICKMYAGTEKPRAPKADTIHRQEPPPSDSPAFAQWARSRAFIQSWAWRELRYRILKARGLKCECCGASPESGAAMMVDHIKPRQRYPQLALDPNNLQVLCSPCNQGKGAWDETDWRKETLT